MIVAAHQPNYIPYLGFFDKMAKSDVFVIFDDGQFADREFIHRNKIRISSGWKWLTIPVFKEKISINEIKINELDCKKIPLWNRQHFREIDDNYRKAPYYDVYADDLKDIYLKKYDHMIDFNMKLIEFLVGAFDINVEMKLTSTLGLESHSTERLVDLMHALGGDVYLSGSGGHKYLDESLFKDIELVYQNYDHPVYKQCFPDFVPNMSAIDALFNVGGLPS